MLLEKQRHGECMRADGGGFGKEKELTPKGQADESKTREAAQRIADAMVAKKLKGMPTKKEVAEWKKLKANRKTEAEKAAEVLKVVEEATRNATMILKKVKAKTIGIYMGIAPQHLDDATILAVDRAGGDVTLEMAMTEIAEKHPMWCLGGIPETDGFV